MDLTDIRDALVVRNADLSGSRFQDVNLSRTTFRNADLSMGIISDARLRGVRIENADLTDLTLCDCRLAGATIDGVPVEAMIAAYRTLNPETD
ncbi:Pentapeptide repeats (8 copies) [Roseivivax sp. THAF40]|uniref:pentapeptide repeat-containing protein n=1 Tax=unclassified Roseivivax TaxID=2639302 RepID=UPI0012AA2098|nr:MULTISPECIES: pentapeptide repeat-containing protein [unclassified Roseivivax]QFS83199.1 Pentapeptide repeats (8 copies) [Roseivivax sp. THAF197b]QFT46943.1 Pentapeptide repeats (8 copies) [Roseivivax sp. THAF40]